MRDALRLNPDVVACWEPHPGEALFRALSALQEHGPVPMLVFTSDAEVEAMERAMAVGVQCWVVQGYGLQRLRSLVQLAQVRFKHERELSDTLEALTHRFEERKLVDRAKGILMRASQVSEDEAFRMLRSASMHGNRRVGQVSQQIIDAARYAEAVNRAGQLRMLSQRLVKLQALVCAGVEAEASRALLAQSIERAEGNLTELSKLLSKPTFGDLIDGAWASWRELKKALAAVAQPVDLAALDEAAQRLLTDAERFTAALEAAGLASTLHVINLAGRQRMLSQRVAKLALLSSLLDAGAAQHAKQAAQQATAAFEQALQELALMPLSTPEIRAGLAEASQTWQALLAGGQHANQPQGRVALAAASEALLELFDRLTLLYERSMQGLMG
ncbi:MAG TPA: type IV pili methyl-accepting chemotaxis transducer N-terminal domain-containing protein [Methylibium sp.]